ncbi:AAA family ATPase [Caballeronia sordidicola]|jgi:predicted ATPase|uniref:ABC transport protein, ATP-binding subunit n=1 Tax=Caballeronia sordidicola TaxID=196367 RepID=A0A242M447_CABSO|nr:AAA family ATPase [Caballeronia sordidicola]OTP65796.1 ABC transport protein, ATP-binding subunit [Caballeronia sordidicola]
MAAVKKLTITGYKSIRELRDFELRNLNVLIGANGAGKSNFISFFRMLAEIVGQRFQLFVAVQGGPDALLHSSRQTTPEIHAEFNGEQDSYYFTLVPTNDNRLVFEDEGLYNRTEALIAGHTEGFTGPHPESQFDKTGGRYTSSVRLGMDRWRVYHFHDTGATAKVKQQHAPFDTLRLQVDGANLAAYLGMLRTSHSDSYRLIVDTIRLVAPFFDDFVQARVDSKQVQLEWLETGKPDVVFNAHTLSDGTLRFICLTTLLLQPWDLMPDTILIDEPELGLHPYAINILADLLKRAAERKQVIVSTQSVELMNLMEPEDIVVVDREDGASTFRRLDSEQLKGWLEDYSLGELWNQNVLGGRPSR